MYATVVQTFFFISNLSHLQGHTAEKPILHSLIGYLFQPGFDPENK